MYSQGFAIAGILSVLIWAYLLLARGRFWQVDRAVVFSKPIQNPSPVAVVVPARNEEEFVARCITSLFEQTCWESIHIFLVDDFSSDRTIAVTREAAERAGRSALLTVTACGPLPPGWTGKLWAVRAGIEEASLLNPKYVLLTDADMVHDPQSIATLLQIAESGGYDLVSVTGRSECETLAERLLTPAFTFFFLMLYPPAWIEDSRHKTAGADGGCMLIRSDALARVGGVESIRHEVIDDCALARTIKRSGGKLYMGVSNLTVGVRGHKSFAQMGRLISRTAFSQLRHSTPLLLATLVGLAVTYVLPVVMTFSNVPVLMALGMSSWAVMTLCYFPVVRFYGLKPQWSPTLPMAVLFYMAATLWSALRFWSSKGGEWKGRVQDLPVRGTFRSREDVRRH